MAERLTRKTVGPHRGRAMGCNSMWGPPLEFTSPSWGGRRASCASAQRRAGWGDASQHRWNPIRWSARGFCPPPGLLRACALRRPTSPQGGGKSEARDCFRPTCDSPAHQGEVKFEGCAIDRVICDSPAETGRSDRQPRIPYVYMREAGGGGNASNRLGRGTKDDTNPVYRDQARVTSCAQNGGALGFVHRKPAAAMLIPGVCLPALDIGSHEMARDPEIGRHPDEILERDVFGLSEQGAALHEVGFAGRLVEERV